MFKEDSIPENGPSGSLCPFDAGNEEMTPPEILRMDISGNVIDGSDADWQIRVVPNKFPALKSIDIPKSVLIGPYSVMDGFGLHEVVINEREHVMHLALLSEDKIRLILDVYARRLKEIKKNDRIESIIIMLNQGKQAGASLDHTHSQLFALPFNSPVLEKEIQGTRKYYRNSGRCPMCTILDFESKEDKRVVFENKHFFMLEPFASRNPFETWIVPKRHYANFEYISGQEIDSFAQCLKILVDFFHYELSGPPFNYYIHTGPLQNEIEGHYHWHFELIPKLSIKAGFEIATGIDICITTPEDTAAFIKEVIKK
jgi:UDPglucose--hexose-1-phosphate uridylyltransferase